jgi:hypothetical protein
MPVRFPYYERLNAADRAVYRLSDRITTVALADDVLARLRGLAAAIEPALAREQNAAAAVRLASAALCRALCTHLELRVPELRVLQMRPRSADASELHGLYTTGERDRPIIRVWMRTAAKRRPVAFRTFLRTLLHELCHHLDFELYQLAESFHTRGFFQRESSLVRQLLPAGTVTHAPPARAAAAQPLGLATRSAMRPSARSTTSAAGPKLKRT